jgi:hypothetical protein
VLSADSVAASNHDDPAVIRGMVDRSKRLASPFGGPSLLRQFYKHVQFASLAWAVARLEPSAFQAGGWSAILASPATVVVSGNYGSPLHLRADAVHVRAEAFTANPEEARGVIDKVNVFVALTHTGENAVGLRGTDPDVKSFFESIEVKQEGNRAVLNAAMPLSFLRKMLAESEPALAEPSSPSPAPHAKLP